MAALRPTPKQLFVLKVLDSRGPKTAKYLGTRSDVLWRMQERGWVASGSARAKWSITEAGRAVLEANEEV